MVAGSDYSVAAIQLARAVAEKRDITSVRWVVDDLLHTSISDRCASPMSLQVAEVACGTCIGCIRLWMALYGAVGMILVKSL